jgi:hypothetical protein
VKLRRGGTGTRRLPILGSAALAVTAVALAAGCSAAPAPAKAATSPAPGFTIAAAQAVYSTYVAHSTTAAKRGDAAAVLPLAGDMQWAMLHAEYTALTTTGTPVTQYSYGKPVFYVPALAEFPFWFRVEVPVRTETNGELGPAVSTLMVFQRYQATRDWTLNGSAVLNQPLPAIAHDSDGYAVALTDGDPGLLLQPDLVGATQAAVVDEGPAAPAATVIGTGPNTTGLYTTQNARGNSATAGGLNYQWLMQGASFAQYELQAASGGAVVLYSMYLNTVTEHPGNVSGPAIPLPAGFGPLVTTAAKTGVHGVDANWTYEFAAVDPPQSAHDAKVEIIGGTGVPTYGHRY